MQRISIVLLVLVVIATIVTCRVFTNDQEMINRINSNPRVAWKAKHYPHLEGKDLSQFLLNNKASTVSTTALKKTQSGFPSSFDARKQWPKCVAVAEIRNQYQCGGSPTFSGVEVLEDRLCIASGAIFNEDLSPEYVLSCDNKDFGCGGAYLDTLWDFLTTNGTVTEKCNPYSSQHGVVPPCPAKCNDGSDLQFFKGKHYQIFNASGTQELLQEELVNHGPVQMTFEVFTDFVSYTSGVYHHTPGARSIGMSVGKVLGWGVDPSSGLPYWTVALSFGEDWGMNGIFWILRGTNEAQCESQLVSVTPVWN